MGFGLRIGEFAGCFGLLCFYVTFGACAWVSVYLLLVLCFDISCVKIFLRSCWVVKDCCLLVFGYRLCVVYFGYLLIALRDFCYLAGLGFGSCLLVDCLCYGAKPYGCLLYDVYVF